MNIERNEIKYFKNLLIQMRDDILQQFKGTEEELNSTIKDSSGEHSSYSFHIADMGTDTSEREKSSMLASLDSDVLNDIENALRKFQKNEYGKCEQCGNEIHHARLEAIPYVRLCLECKTNEEYSKR